MDPDTLAQLEVRTGVEVCLSGSMCPKGMRIFTSRLTPVLEVPIFLQEDYILSLVGVVVMYVC